MPIPIEQKKELLTKLQEQTGKSEAVCKAALESAEWDFDKAAAALKQADGEAQKKERDDLQKVVDSIQKKIQQLEGLGKKTEYIEKLKSIFSDGEGGLSELQRIEQLEREIESLRSKSREIDSFFNARFEEAIADLSDEVKALIPAGTAKEKYEWVERYKSLHKSKKEDEGRGGNINFGTDEPVPGNIKNLKYEDLLDDTKKLIEVKKSHPAFFAKLRDEYYGKF
ncbi:MAG: hypothetical protein P8012_13475 [Desulfobacterales bacterium]